MSYPPIDLSETILEYVATKSDSAVVNPQSGYYPFDVIADAYKKGVEKGEERLKESMRVRYLEKAKLTSEAAKRIISSLESEGFQVRAIFLKINFDSSSMLLSVDDKTHLSDEFIDSVYRYSSDIKTEFFEKGLNLSIGFLGDYSSANLHSIECDGFEIAFDFEQNKKIKY